MKRVGQKFRGVGVGPLRRDEKQLNQLSEISLDDILEKGMQAIEGQSQAVPSQSFLGEQLVGFFGVVDQSVIGAGAEQGFQQTLNLFWLWSIVKAEHLKQN